MRSRIVMLMIVSGSAQAHEGLQYDGWLHGMLHRLGAGDWLAVAIGVGVVAVIGLALRVWSRATGLPRASTMTSRERRPAR